MIDAHFRRLHHEANVRTIIVCTILALLAAASWHFHGALAPIGG